jgi:capsular polysaccharide biosynthesis protein
MTDVLNPEMRKEVRQIIDEKMTAAKAKIGDANDAVVESIKAKPLTWVAGAFVAGVAIAYIASRRRR